MHYAKYNKAQVSSILMHSDRGLDGEDTHEHSNEKIDKSRTHLNYDLKERDGLTAYQYYKARLDALNEKTKARTGKGIRKDAVSLCSWVITAPQTLPEDKHEDFFRECYAWFSERYGESNIVTAAVHKDETTPHLHFQFMPVVTDKDGTERLCAKNLETRASLQRVHQTLEKHLTARLGCKVELINGATVNGSKTVAELKVEELKKEIKELEKARSTEILEKTSIIKAIGQKLSGGNRKLTADEVEQVKNVVATVEQMQEEYRRQVEIARQAKRAYESEQERLQALCKNEQAKIQAEAQRLAQSRVAQAERKVKDIERQLAKETDKLHKAYEDAVAVCEWATGEPFEQTGERYDAYITEQRSKQAKSLGKYSTVSFEDDYTHGR